MSQIKEEEINSNVSSPVVTSYKLSKAKLTSIKKGTAHNNSLFKERLENLIQKRASSN